MSDINVTLDMTDVQKYVDALKAAVAVTVEELKNSIDNDAANRASDRINEISKQFDDSSKTLLLGIAADLSK